MSKIQIAHDVTGNEQEVRGSDNRLNVSSRADNRAYYNSRDVKQTYTMTFDHQAAASGEYSAYLQNTSEDKVLVISSVGINTVENSKLKLCFVSGTAAGGVVKTPVNLNKSSPNSAKGNFREGSEGSPITGLTNLGEVDYAYVTANGHQEFRLTDRVRLGQNDAIAINYHEGVSGDCAGVFFGYYE